jgi:hypothetical protein
MKRRIQIFLTSYLPGYEVNGYKVVKTATLISDYPLIKQTNQHLSLKLFLQMYLRTASEIRPQRISHFKVTDTTTQSCVSL